MWLPSQEQHQQGEALQQLQQPDMQQHQYRLQGQQLQLQQQRELQMLGQQMAHTEAAALL